MGRHYRRHSSSRRKDESDDSYSDSRSRSRSVESSRHRSRRSERRSHSSRNDKRYSHSSRSVSSESRHSSPDRVPTTSNNKEDDYFPKAQVTESGGEISCSIEETNRIRAELGLPPLELDNEEETKTEDGVVLINMEKQQREQAIKEKLEKSRQRREQLEYQNLEGKGLGDLLTEENKDLDVRKWLESSKEKQEKALEEMEEEEEEKEEEKERRMKEASVSLAGLKVAHDIAEIGEGDTILTLRDTPLIDANGNINNDEDILESIDLVTKEKQKEINKLREKAKLPVYTGLDDHEFDSDFDEEDRLLPQYAEKKKKEVFFTLTDRGVSESDLEKSKLMAKERAKTQSVNPLAISSSSPVTSTIVKPSITSLLSSIQSEKKIASEYYTNEEMSQFKKKRKRVRKVRQIEKEEDETPLQLEETVDNEMTSRKRLHVKDDKDELKKEREAGYQRAKEKEEIRNRGLSKKSASSQEGVEEVYDDPLLSDSLIRARKVVLGQRRSTIEEIAARVKKEKEDEKDDDDEQQEQSSMEAVNEFSKRFKALMKERKKEKEEEEEEMKEVKEEEMKEEEMKEEEEKEEEMKEEEEKKEEDDEEEELYDQPNISQGLGGVLSYLKSQHITDTYEEAYGRRTDSVIDSSNKDDGFVIEYRDKDGRLLTNKEAFRQLSYQFHGKTPGQKNKSRKNTKYTKGLANKGVF